MTAGEYRRKAAGLRARRFAAILAGDRSARLALELALAELALAARRELGLRLPGA